MLSTEKSENRFRAILLTFVLLLSAIVMIPNTASAEDERLEAHINAHKSNINVNIWIEGADHSSNYTAGWAVTDENDNIRDSGVLHYDGSDENPGEPGWWFDLDIPDYDKGEYIFTVELYDDSGSMLDDFQETFWVHTWLDIEAPYHLEEAGNVTVVFTSGAIDPNSTYQIDWELYDRDDETWTEGGNISGSEGNLTFYLEKGSYDFQAILYRFEGDENDTYWEHEDSAWREFNVGSQNMEFWFEYYRGEAWAEVWVQFPDENVTTYYVVWNITNSTGAEIDNGSEEMWEHENYVHFYFNAAYPEGTYNFNIELYSNQTNISLDSQSRHFEVWSQLAISASTHYLEEPGNITFEFLVIGSNSTHEYMINWTLWNDEGYEVDNGQLYDSEGNITIYLDDEDYYLDGQLYMNYSHENNESYWGHLDSTSLHGIHVGGASLDNVWFDYYDSWISMEGNVQYSNYSSDYTFAWAIEDGNGNSILNGTVDPEHEDEFWFYEEFELQLLAGDYIIKFFLYENNQMVDTEMMDFTVYPSIYLTMEEEWLDGSYVNANYSLNIESTTYTLNWTLRDANNWVDVENGTFNSDATEGMLEFFNLSAGEYYLEIKINSMNMDYFGQDLWFWVENDPEMNRDPYCDLSNNITIGSNIAADVGDNFTFSANCFDMDGDSMTLSAAVEHASLAAPFFFADMTGNASTWTYNLSEPGLYAFGMSVEDSNGAKQAYAFVVTAYSNDNNTDLNETTEEEILEAIESGELPSVSMFASVVAIALIALRRRD